MKYNLDYVFCIDGTKSMSSCIETVRDTVKMWIEQTRDTYEEIDKQISALRAKIIVFRDFAFHGDKAIEETPFFVFPEEKEALYAFLDSIETKGESPLHGSNALEAISLALKSDWTNAPDKRWHVIFVFSDKYAYPLSKRAKCANYPKDMPKDLAELGYWWEGAEDFGGTYQSKCGRMIVFAPNMEPWTEMQAWNRYWHIPSKAGVGLDDISFGEFLGIIEDY